MKKSQSAVLVGILKAIAIWISVFLLNFLITYLIIRLLFGVREYWIALVINTVCWIILKVIMYGKDKRNGQTFTRIDPIGDETGDTSDTEVK